MLVGAGLLLPVSAAVAEPSSPPAVAASSVGRPAPVVAGAAVCAAPHIVPTTLMRGAYGSAGLDLVGGITGWVAEQEPTRGRGGPVLTDRIKQLPAGKVPGTGPEKPRGGVMSVHLERYESAPGAEDGDVTVTGGVSGNRAEVYGRYPERASTTEPGDWPDPPGSTRYYSFAVLVPEGHTFATDTKWMTLTQFKGFRGGSPPVALEIKRDHFIVGGANGALKSFVPNGDLGEVVPGRWTHFTFGLHYSTSAREGWVEVYRDGQMVTPRSYLPTLDVVNGQADPAYLKQGIYRTKSWAVPHTVYFGPTTVTDWYSGR
ncbi:polysaccharide lyase-like protein [Pseudokineococcus lusitanus]|uniref:Polysaccharide lyase-like protein n=1 Tax=Pseudokineococcus lusitanus TaxID=763993 RepID=A0A3N1G9A6_9ACTN|nr:polysaccharide lyase-like protein [Pseudokineococcus lusitanus]